MNRLCYNYHMFTSTSSFVSVSMHSIRHRSMLHGCSTCMYSWEDDCVNLPCRLSKFVTTRNCNSFSPRFWASSAARVWRHQPTSSALSIPSVCFAAAAMKLRQRLAILLVDDLFYFSLHSCASGSLVIVKYFILIPVVCGNQFWYQLFLSLLW